MSTWLKCIIYRSVEILSFLCLTETAKVILYFQTALAARREEETPKVLVENEEKLAGGQVFSLSYLT